MLPQVPAPEQRTASICQWREENSVDPHISFIKLVDRDINEVISLPDGKFRGPKDRRANGRVLRPGIGTEARTLRLQMSFTTPFIGREKK